MKKRLLYFSAMLFLYVAHSSYLSAEINLPAIIGDNMVLQQQTNAVLWGKASASAKVFVKASWNGTSYSVRADNNGNWEVKIPTPSAGGPYTISISDGKPLIIRNVLIGEVWICSGQSNMEMPMKGYRNQPVNGSNEFIVLSSNPNIRMITVPHQTSLSPLDDFKGTWKLCEPENVSEFSATAYFFGLMLNRTLNVPVGLINTSWGGTRIEPWISEAGFKNFDWVKLPDKNVLQENLSKHTPTVLFNAMINPIVGYGIRGSIWYQGEQNHNEPQQYQKLMLGLSENWRAEWGIGEFPMYYVQIAPYYYGPNAVNSAYLREAQLLASISGKNMVLSHFNAQNGVKSIPD